MVVSEIGNLNEDNFEMECVLCGRGEGLITIAHRNSSHGRIVGFVIACRDCRSKVYGAGFQLLLSKKEEIDGRDSM